VITRQTMITALQAAATPRTAAPARPAPSLLWVDWLGPAVASLSQPAEDMGGVCARGKQVESSLKRLVVLRRHQDGVAPVTRHDLDDNMVGKW
jgi:hypothetical protein